MNELIVKVLDELKFYVQNTNSKQKSICLTGGRTAKALYENIKVQNLLHNNFTHFYFGDERCVGSDHPESNYQLAVRSLFTNGQPPGCILHRMQGESSNPEQEADRYAELLPDSFDVLLLSVGEDGHIASLFPNSTAVTEAARKVVPVINAPKPPSERLTITPPVIRNAKKVIVMAAGVEKGAILAKALSDPSGISELPVRLTISTTWILDDAAYASFMDSAPADYYQTSVLSAES